MIARYLIDRARRGFSSIEIVTAIAVMGAMIAIAGRLGGELSRVSAASSLAHSLNMAAASARNYMESQKDALLAHLDGRDHVYVTRDAVFDQGGTVLDGGGGFGPWLPARGGRTRFGQELRLYLFKGPERSVKGLLATWGGAPARSGRNVNADRRYMAVARKVVGMNGFGLSVSRTPSGSRTEPAFVGDSGSWRFPFDDPEYGMIPASEFPDGQLARPLQIFAQKPMDNILYRVDAGELNTMRTNIDMGGNDIRHAGKIEAEGVLVSPIDRDRPAGEVGTEICREEGRDGFVFTMSDHGGELAGLWFCMGGDARLVSDFVNSRTLRASITVRPGDLVARPSCPPVTKARIAMHPPSFTAIDEGPNWRVADGDGGRAHAQIYCEREDRHDSSLR